MNELQWRKLAQNVWYITKLALFFTLLAAMIYSFITDEAFRGLFLAYTLPLAIGLPLIMAFWMLLSWLQENDKRIRELEKECEAYRD